MHILVIEPHPDDAFLSLGWHLEELWKDYQRTILTVYANDIRAREAYRYATTIGAQSIVLGLEESRMDSTPDGPVVREKALDKVLSDLTFDEIVFPLGIQHPDHLKVSAVGWPGCWRYIDTPYQTKTKNQEELQSRTSTMQVVSLSFPGVRKWRHIPIFKSQAKFFHFNKMATMRLPEIVLTDLVVQSVEVANGIR